MTKKNTLITISIRVFRHFVRTINSYANTLKFNTIANTTNKIAANFVDFTKAPSIERPLFCPQYDSAAPLIVPSPADLPS